MDPLTPPGNLNEEAPPMGAVGSSGSVVPLTAEQTVFHMEEFKSIKAEIAELVKTTYANLQYAILTSGGLFAWLFTTIRSPSAVTPSAPAAPAVPVADLAVVAFLPMIISVAFGLLSVAAYMRVVTKWSYIARLEQTMAAPPLGWERSGVSKARLIFWVYSSAWTLLAGFDLYLGWRLYSIIRAGS